MSSRFNTVRMKYIYICGASAVLSIVLLCYVPDDEISLSFVVP